MNTPISTTILDAMERDGWTPQQVRELIASYRELSAELVTANDALAEYLCDECGGMGKWHATSNPKSKMVTCHRCGGTGREP